MAKRENTEEVQGGLTAGLNFSASRDAKQTNGQDARRSELVDPAVEYKAKLQQEKRSIKFNVLLQPSLAAKMDKAVKRGEIKSRGHLINVLLERYFDEVENEKRK